jgi:3-hydroxymyristoyl/3-hydroxydecanoyl-(acyl carrier protein) dehydratase
MPAEHITLRFASPHPACAGHFPGNPIIPGAVLLDEIVRGIAAAYKVGDQAGEIRSAKFLRPVRPGDMVDVQWDVVSPSQEVRFECLQAGKRALSGILKLSARPG